MQTIETGFGVNGESNLDLQYAMALVGKNQPVTLYQVGDLPQGMVCLNIYTSSSQPRINMQVHRSIICWTHWMARSAPLRAGTILSKMVYTRIHRPEDIKVLLHTLQIPNITDHTLAFQATTVAL